MILNVYKYVMVIGWIQSFAQGRGIKNKWTKVLDARGPDLQEPCPQLFSKEFGIKFWDLIAANFSFPEGGATPSDGQSCNPRPYDVLKGKRIIVMQ